MFNFFVLIQFLLPHHLLSKIAGLLAESKVLKNFLIITFIRRYKVDISEAKITDASDYKTFNHFFTRELKPEARQVDLSLDTVVSPADGKISACGKIMGSQLLQAKDHHFSLCDLLGGDGEASKLFINGSYATVYLSPKDYHRVHMPISGKLISTFYIPGSLFSVNEVMSKSISNLFARNERVVCLFQTKVGPMCLILVGAMIVGSIETTWGKGTYITHSKTRVHATDYSSLEKPIEFSKGQELGRFKLGSTVITLFGSQAISMDTKIKMNYPIKMGQKLGYIRHLNANH